MQTPKHSVAREPDERLAPLLFVYLAGVVATFFALLSWVFWFRGYA